MCVMTLTKQVSIMIWFVIGLIITRVHCMNAKFQGKVVNGIPVNIENHGYSANFIVLGKQKILCGASIINQNIIMTAAHCFESATRGTKFLITMGHNDRQKGNIYQMKKSKVHESYNPETLRNDIALIHLAQDIPLGKRMYRIALSRATPKAGVIAELTGWGWINDKPVEKSQLLHITKQKIWAKKRCHRVIPIFPSKTFCAGGVNVSYPANGDSGSALVVKDYLQIGIVSFSMKRKKRVIFYTDVSRFLKWIKKNVRGLTCRNITV